MNSGRILVKGLTPVEEIRSCQELTKLLLKHFDRLQLHEEKVWERCTILIDKNQEDAHLDAAGEPGGYQVTLPYPLKPSKSVRLLYRIVELSPYIMSLRNDKYNHEL